jgi:hypothetical protein
MSFSICRVTAEDSFSGVTLVKGMGALRLVNGPGTLEGVR